MEQILKNSKHATASTLNVTASKQQTRATFIYFAPFLQPCKNVVTTIPTQTTATTITKTSIKPLQQQQQTHVAHNRLNSSRNKYNNTNTLINMTGTRPCCCCSNSTTLTATASSAPSSLCTHHQHHKYHEERSSSGNSYKNNSCSSIVIGIGSGGDKYTSCCHNNTLKQQQLQQQQQLQLQNHKEKQVKEQQQKDEYFKNYEMPALETTTTIKTATAPLLYSSHNKLRQETQQQIVHLTKQKGSQEQKQQQQQLLLLLPQQLTTSLCSSPLSTSFVNNTNNNRSTKYLRDRNRRNIITLQKQQPLEQTLKEKTHATLSKEEEQQRNITCVSSGRGTRSVRARASGGLYVLKESDNNNNNNVNPQMASSTLMSRCHCYNRQHNNDNDNNNIMLSNVQDMKQQQQTNKLILYNTQQQQQLQQQEKLQIYSHDCDVVDADQQLNYHYYDVENVQTEEEKENKNFNINLRLSKNLNDVKQEQQQDKNSYINYNELLFYSNPATTNTATNTNTNTTTSLIIPTLSISTHSYTTILNKECRCFIQKQIQQQEQEVKECKRDTITTGIEYLNRSSSTQPLAFCRTSPSVSNISSNSNSNSNSNISHSRSGSGSSNSISSLHQSLVKIWPQAALNGCSRFSKTVVVSKWLFMWLLLAMLSTSAHCWAGRNDVPTNCTFPARWEGSWFLSGYQQSIHIKGSQFSYRGRCAASDGNKYLIVDEKGCHRCLVIYEKHNNVLQYKESECEGDSMYMHQTNPSAMAMRSVLNQKTNNNGGDHRGGAHPNLNGHSRLSSSDQYIMRSNDDMNDCPPDFCKGRETLQNLCDQIPGDALLYSLFRESAEPVKCPLKGPFIFTYNRGNGECKNPVSNIESCTEDSRLLLSFQACPDVVGTESTVEELTCLATWKDGNSRYLVGLVSHHHAISNEERYRCFVYEKISSLMDLGHFSGPSMSTSKDAEYKLAQSGDATCNGLDSAEVGSRIMSLRKPPVTERCDFPVWFKGPRHWHVLMGNAVYNYHTNDGSIHIIKPNGYMETRALCEQINKQTSTEMMSVVHYTTGCQSGFMCMMFYRRDTHVIEIQTGKPASRLEDACAPDHFDINKTPYITLLASNPDPQICPMEGLYSLRGAIGPPYLTTRHKRNHNKAHGLHNHHHQYDGSNSGREFMHKRHSSLSFRNSNHDEKNAWHSNTRGLPVRSRRDASSTITPLATIGANQSHAVVKTTQEILVVGNNTNVGFVQAVISDTRLRSRRNVPECVTNYKAQRQLWVGCTEPNVIDVRPLCNDEGDEEYSCHGSWSENGTVFIIARHKGTKHGVCISYRPTEGTLAKLVVGDACYRGTQKPPEHHLVANLSVFGKCGETGSISSTMPVISWFNMLMATILITILTQLPIQR